MPRFSQKVLRILDGSPGALGGYQRGQSLVELLLVTPLLIIMVAGIIEIGWYANHVLILLEVTRVGARQATLFTGEYGYQVWDSDASLAPITYRLANDIETAKPDLDDWNPKWLGTPTLALPTIVPDKARNFRDCDPTMLGQSKGFYNSVICSMMNTLDPLTIKGREPATADILAKRIRQDYNGTPLIGLESTGGRLWFTYDYNELFLYPDDIVVSVFSVQAVNNGDKNLLLTPVPPSATIDANMYARTHNFGDKFPRGYQAIVVGRYPTNANECNVTFTPGSDDGTPTGNPFDAGDSFLKRLLTVGAVETDYQYRSSWDTQAANMTAPDLPAGTLKYETYDGTKFTLMFRDPFEFYGTSFPESDANVIQNQIDGRYVELAGLDKTPEIQRGFVYTGQHIINGLIDPVTGRQLFCIGSEWSDERVQDMMNSPSFLQKGIVKPPDGDPLQSGPAGDAWRAAGNEEGYAEWQQRAKFLPSQGVVLVEMFWRHDILLDFPLMTPIIRLMEGAGGPYNIVISVWAVFPLPSAEPNLNFGFPKK